MKRPAVFQQIQKSYQAHSKARRDLMVYSNDALSKSKRAIFALHRNDFTQAREYLDQAQALFKSCEASFRSFSELKEEGTYRAGLEEYAEACLFESYLQKGSIGKIDPRAMASSIYLAGLCDATGEMVRYAVRQVTLGHPEGVVQIHETVSMIIEFLLDLDLTGYVRTKFDQAKKNLSRLEEMSYDLAIRK